ncbi:MAG: DUF262 domain-containing protein [Hyphomicrobiaceae bacterium]
MPDDTPVLGPPKDGLSVAFLTVEELYAGPYTFNLPWYQRAYAWSDDLALRLLNDIIQANEEHHQRYFIGHVLLARQIGQDRHVLVDGQQRAVTLMILFALLRDKLRGTEWATRLTPLLDASARPGDGQRQYRLTPQPAVQKFFRDYIQSPDALARPADEFALSEVEGNILRNRVQLGERLDAYQVEQGNLAGLAEFLLTRCLLVLEVIDGESENEAWKMLQTEENTGLPFHDSARAKVSLISAMQASEREAAGKLWEKCQAKLGDDGMQQLITHIRDLAYSKRSLEPVEKNIITRFGLNERGLQFMRAQLVPNAERLTALRQHQVGTTELRPQISRFLRHMEFAGHVYWCPAAMRWLECYGGSHRDSVAFFRLLARKVWLLRIAGADQVEHERRFIGLSNEIKLGHAPADMSELDVPAKLQRKARENLLSRTFYDKRYSRPVLRYLSDLLGADPGEISGDLVTIEHVLPRNPGERSNWAKVFGNVKSISDYAHRIGNLALLSFKDNQLVGNREYIDKREVLQNSGFVLSQDAATVDQWTPELVIDRSERLVRHMFEHWELDNE